MASNTTNVALPIQSIRAFKPVRSFEKRASHRLLKRYASSVAFETSIALFVGSLAAVAGLLITTEAMIGSKPAPKGQDGGKHVDPRPGQRFISRVRAWVPDEGRKD